MPYFSYVFVEEMDLKAHHGVLWETFKGLRKMQGPEA